MNKRKGLTYYRMQPSTNSLFYAYNGIQPDTNGIEMLEWTRDYIDWPIPVLFVTQQDSDEDIVYALEKGADDYMAKPVKGREMLARIKSLGRRGQRQPVL